ncbi:hypothetical protein V6N11_024396 [Hibiscus sabdariffa]|uniref:Uncharacterized protein n=1 Tax=Hibiscus sabdariffa TaxID=183260 RepID=A0ABR2NEZ1_9ROSI
MFLFLPPMFMLMVLFLTFYDPEFRLDSASSAPNSMSGFEIRNSGASVVIGTSLRASDSSKTIRPLVAALTFRVTNLYNKSSGTALIVEGLLNAASAGILIYIGTGGSPLLATDFMNPKLQLLQVGAGVFLLLGATLMSLLAI